MEGVWLAKVTARPEVAVALTVPVPPTTTVGAVPKAILCALPVTAMLPVTVGAMP